LGQLGSNSNRGTPPAAAGELAGLAASRFVPEVQDEIATSSASSVTKEYRFRGTLILWLLLATKQPETISLAASDRLGSECGFLRKPHSGTTPLESESSTYSWMVIVTVLILTAY